MKIATTALVLLVTLASAAIAADDTVESVVSGTLTIQLVPATPPGAEAPPDAPQAGQVTVRLGTKKAAAQPDKLEECGSRWNKRLAEHNKRLELEKGKRSRGQLDRPLSRYHYRETMYLCLEGGGQQTPTTAQQPPDPGR
jgi:hypothetical protein